MFKRMFSDRPAQSGGAPTAGVQAHARFKPSEVLAINLSDRAAQAAVKFGFKVAQHTNLPNLGMSVSQLSAPDGMAADKASEYLARQLPGESFSLNHVYSLYQAATGSHEPPEGVTNAAPRHSSKQEACLEREHCYGSSMIRWNADVQSCAKGVKVGVIDTGVDLNHPTFAEHKVIVTHILPNGRVPAANWHGTGVLAMLAGDPLSGTPGLIPDAVIYMADVFFADTEGFPISDSMAMLRALDLMEKYEVEVVNLSVSGPKDKAVEHAITAMAKKGVIFVAAAGNDGPAAPAAYPAAYPPVIAVTAVDSELRGYRYANRGAYISVAAPGVKIWTALPDSKEGYQSGTSFAAPYVTAVAAALYPYLPGKKKQRNKDAMMTWFNYRVPSEPGASSVYGKGLIMAPNLSIGPDGRCRLKPLPASPWVASNTDPSENNQPRVSPRRTRAPGGVRPAGN
jgi:minor extracellular protease Epr